jgi:ribosomal protein L11 methyltransferase
MRWVRIAVWVPPRGEDAAAALLLEAGCRGTEHPSEGCVVGYLPADDRFEAIFSRIRSSLAGFPYLGLSDSAPEVSLSFLDEACWDEAWKQHFHPICVGRRLIVAPPWEQPADSEGRIVVKINPGMAFGTGAHPSTRLCLQALEQCVHPGMRVVDLGTGSGILAVAAAKLGAAVVAAADNDPNALRVARANLEANGVADRVILVEADSPKPFRNADVLVANILAEVIASMAESIPSALAEDGVFIGSGIAEGQEPLVTDALETAGMRCTEILGEEGWLAVLAKPKAASECNASVSRTR